MKSSFGNCVFWYSHVSFWGSNFSKHIWAGRWEFSQKCHLLIDIWYHQFTTYNVWEGHTLFVEMLLYAMYFLGELCVYLERHNSGERGQVSMVMQHQFIHPFMHTFNKSISGKGGVLLPHKTHHEFSTLTSYFELKQEMLLNVKISQSMFCFPYQQLKQE